MKIYDISQEVFCCEVYEGDTAPSMRAVKRTENGDLYNLTDFSMCAHNGTHIDAPFHFIGDGKTVEEIPLVKTVGECYVVQYNGNLGADDADKIIKSARTLSPRSSKRILLKGNAIVSTEAARILAENEIYLIGVESQSVGEKNAPMEVHKILLKKEVVLLEGIRLSEIDEGVYFLVAVPLCLGGADAAPCRAILMDMK